MMRSQLAAAGITAPQHAVGGDTVRFGKPNSEGYLRGADILTRQPQDCLVIEDAPAGIRAGKAAGCSVLAIASSHRPEELHEADWIITSIDQIRVASSRNCNTQSPFPSASPSTFVIPLDEWRR
jgi:sugar-phosphatase